MPNGNGKGLKNERKATMSEVSLPEKMKKAALSAGEEHLMLAVDHVYQIAQVYVDDTESPIDNTLLEGLKLLKSSLKEVVDQIDGEDDHQS